MGGLFPGESSTAWLGPVVFRWTQKAFVDGCENLSALHVSFVFFKFSMGRLVLSSKEQPRILEHSTRDLPLFICKQQTPEMGRACYPWEVKLKSFLNNLAGSFQQSK